MVRINRKPWLLRLLRRFPMPLLAIFVGLVAGLAVWAVLEQVQSRQVKKIFDEELRTRLELRSRENLIRFDQYLSNYGATVRLLANHRRLAEYLEPLFWSPSDRVEPVRYSGSRPDWLPDFFERNALRPPSQVLLVDRAGRVREIFQAGADPLPAELSRRVEGHLLDASEVRTVLTTFGDRLYLLVSDAMEDLNGYSMGSLVVLTPVDADFLRASQRGLPLKDTEIALVDSEEQEILVSLDPQRLFPNTPVSEWTDTYLVTSQSLPQYEGSDLNLVLTTFVSRASVDKMSRHVRHFERRQRGIAALVFIATFTLVIYVVSFRLNRVLRRLARFSYRALGVEEPKFRRGANQLVLLEEWIPQFTRLVLRAREEMRRQHAREMRRTEALKAAVMEASLDAILTLDAEGRIRELNPAAQRLFGDSRQGILDREFSTRFLPPSAHPSFRGLLQSCREGRLGTRMELDTRRSDGTLIPVELSIAPIHLDQRFFYTLYLHDIRPRRRAEREIRSLARLASESPNPILRVDGAGRLIYANAASDGLRRDWGKQGRDRLPPNWSSEVGEVLEGGRQREREQKIGACLYSLLFVPIPEFGYVNIYAQDITAIRRTEGKLRQHQAELVHVCRLSTLGEVAAGMAHELNQPLSAITNYANGCIRRLRHQNGAPPDALIPALEQIGAQAHRAAEIIRRLRSLVGKQPPTRAPADLNALVREVCSFLEFEIRKLGVPIALQLAPTPIPVDVDRVQIEQVLLNLVRNGLDALEGVPVENRRLAIGTRSEGTFAEVWVEDNGPGIGPDQKVHLFDPFFTTKASGMGMGLPISQTIVQNHQGTIDLRSRSGETVFSVRLPLSPENRSEAEESP